MCKAVQDLIQRGINEGLEIGEKKGLAIGADNALINAIKNVMANTKQSYEYTCQTFGISPEDMKRYREMM